MPLEPGTYFLENVMSDTVLSLRGDRKGVEGFALYEGKDQQWEIGKLGNRGWFIRNCYSAGDHYLTVEKGLGHCSDIAVNEFPAAWVFEHEPRQGENIYWIHWPNSRFSFDLDGGKRNDGVKVYLVNRYDARQQLWKLIRCPEKDQTITTLMEEDGRGTTTTTTVTTITTTTRTSVIRRDDLEGKSIAEEPLPD